MTPEFVAIIISVADALLDLLISVLGPDETREKLERRVAIKAARAAADAAARKKFSS